MERAIIHGIPTAIPGRYSIEIDVCREMGWTYADLMSTPADMIDEIIVRMSAENKATSQRHKMEQNKGKK